MNKDKLERMCRAAGMSPEVRKQTKNGEELFIADGFHSKPQDIWWRFGATNEEFPFGAYCTLWWLADNEDHVKWGVPLLFEAFHDSDKQWDLATKKIARINKAEEEAEAFIAAQERARADA